MRVSVALSAALTFLLRARGSMIDGHGNMENSTIHDGTYRASRDALVKQRDPQCISETPTWSLLEFSAASTGLNK